MEGSKIWSLVPQSRLFKITAYLVSQLLDRGLAGLSLFDKLDDLAERRVLANVDGLHQDHVVLKAEMSRLKILPLGRQNNDWLNEECLKLNDLEA